MRFDIKKFIKINNLLIYTITGAGIMSMVIVISLIISQMFEREALLNEGITKSAPLIKDELTAKLGEIYISKENEFESEIKNIVTGIANRKNLRGDDIYYGVDGKRNVDRLKDFGYVTVENEEYMDIDNLDYVNGVNLTYVNNDENRADGESNFNDLLAVISSIYGADADKYEDEVIEMFEYLFDISHTYNAYSSDLYPCEHGCAWCKYYCGDYKVTGKLSSSEGGTGDQVQFYKCDSFLGLDDEYGLMYSPWIINKESNYNALKELADDANKMKVSITGPTCHFSFSSEKCTGTPKAFNAKAKVTVDDTTSDIFYKEKAVGTCPVCSAGRTTFTSTTRTFSGCVPIDMELSDANIALLTNGDAYNDDYDSGLCYHGSYDIIKDKKNEVREKVWHSVGISPSSYKCDSYEAISCCPHIHTSSCEGEEGLTCGHTSKEEDPVLRCRGEYNCLGHTHYACPGHIVVCCFGHTTLDLDITILYNEEIINELSARRKSDNQ